MSANVLAAEAYLAGRTATGGPHKRPPRRKWSVVLKSFLVQLGLLARNDLTVPEWCLYCGKEIKLGPNLIWFHLRKRDWSRCKFAAAPYSPVSEK